MRVREMKVWFFFFFVFYANSRKSPVGFYMDRPGSAGFVGSKGLATCNLAAAPRATYIYTNDVRQTEMKSSMEYKPGDAVNIYVY